MIKAACLVLLIAYLAAATDYRLAGSNFTTAPWTKMTTATTAVSGKSYAITFVHTASDTWNANEGHVAFCCATAVSDSTRSASIKDKCFILQLRCTTSTCDSTSANVTPQLNAGTYSSTTGVTIGTAMTTPTVTAASKVYTTSAFTPTEAEAMSMGLPHTLSPTYKVDIKCWADTKRSSYSTALSGAIAVASLPSNTQTFSIGSGSISSIVSVGVFSVASIFYAMF